MSTSESPLRVIIVTPFGSGGRGGMDRLSDAIIEGVRRTAGDSVQVRALATYGQGSRALMPLHFLKALLELVRLRATAQADLLHINVAGGGSAYRKALLALWARALGLPHVVHLHGSRFRETWPIAAPWRGALLDSMFANSDRILVLGQVWADHVARSLPAVADRIVILPNAAPARPPRPERDTAAPVHIVFMGLLGERKGSLLLIEALSRIDPALAWKATIAGNGDVAAHRQAAERLGVANRVRLPGWLGPAEVEALLLDADVLTLPSFAENLPMVIIEAFAYGVPVVATPVGAVAEVVEDGVTGFLAPVGDAGALAAAIQKLVESSDLRRKLGAAARESHARRFEMTGYIERLIQIWRSARSGVAAAKE